MKKCRGKAGHVEGSWYWERKEVVGSEERSRRLELSCTGRGMFHLGKFCGRLSGAALLETGAWPQICSWAERHPDCREPYLGPELGMMVTLRPGIEAVPSRVEDLDSGPKQTRFASSPCCQESRVRFP